MDFCFTMYHPVVNESRFNERSTSLKSLKANMNRWQLGFVFTLLLDLYFLVLTYWMTSFLVI